jgi:ribA/ribD-fused uncharacterized protein
MYYKGLKKKEIFKCVEELSIKLSIPIYEILEILDKKKVPNLFNDYYNKYGIIRFFDQKEEYGEFSNFYSAPIKYQNKLYPTSEHLYQALKFIYDGASKDSLEYGELIRKAKTPNISKILAGQKTGGGYKWRTDLNPIIKDYLERGVKLREDWEQVKDKIMLDVLRLKFKDSRFKNLLLSTNNSLLIESSPYDYYWGEGKDGTGKNQLGKSLMILREEIRNS